MNHTLVQPPSTVWSRLMEASGGMLGVAQFDNSDLTNTYFYVGLDLTISILLIL